MAEIQFLSKPRVLKTKAYARMFSVLFIIFVVCDAQAQFYPYNPYNPYMNPGSQAGQQLGNAIAQRSKYGRNQLRKAIKKWGECNNGTLSLEHGAVALYGSNGYFCSAAVDDRISSKLKSINKSGGTINDVNITENGNFIVVYNDKEWYGVLPSGLKSVLDEFMAQSSSQYHLTRVGLMPLQHLMDSRVTIPSISLFTMKMLMTMVSCIQ